MQSLGLIYKVIGKNDSIKRMFIILTKNSSPEYINNLQTHFFLILAVQIVMHFLSVQLIIEGDYI